MKLTSLFVLTTALILFQQKLKAQTHTEGLLTFEVTTLSNGVAYAPRHVLAIWIKDGSGNFIKSRKVMAAARKQHLVKWVASSNNNSTDAITGATLTQHTSHTVSWDCRDLQGLVVADGNYEVWIEYTSTNSANNGVAGPFYSYTFTKGTQQFALSLPDQMYFKNMTLTYTPSAVGIPEAEASSVYPIQIRTVDRVSTVNFELPEAMPVHLAVYDLQGRRMLELCDNRLDAGHHTFSMNSMNVPEGIFLVRLWTPKGNSVKKWQVSPN
jgi:hypothetical protein